MQVLTINNSFAIIDNNVSMWDGWKGKGGKMDVSPVVKLVGKKESRYTDKDSGELRRMRLLWVEYPYTEQTDTASPDYQEDGPGELVEGVQVAELRCPRGVQFHSLQRGAYYSLVYELNQFGSKIYANLVNLVPFEEKDKATA